MKRNLLLFGFAYALGLLTVAMVGWRGIGEAPPSVVAEETTSEESTSVAIIADAPVTTAMQPSKTRSTDEPGSLLTMQLPVESPAANASPVEDMRLQPLRKLEKTKPTFQADSFAQLDPRTSDNPEPDFNASPLEPGNGDLFRDPILLDDTGRRVINDPVRHDQATPVPTDVFLDSLDSSPRAMPESDEPVSNELDELREQLAQLAKTKAGLLNKKSLEVEIEKMKSDISNLHAARKLLDARQALERMIIEFPQSPAAERARMMLKTGFTC